MNATQAIVELLRDVPRVGAPHDVRLTWHRRKAETLDAIAAEAEAKPSLVDPVEARRVAEHAWRQVARLEAHLPITETTGAAR